MDAAGVSREIPQSVRLVRQARCGFVISRWTVSSCVYSPIVIVGEVYKRLSFSIDLAWARHANASGNVGGSRVRSSRQCTKLRPHESIADLSSKRKRGIDED
jgi:alkylated DNA nucleotide flippase Atl1